MDLKKLRMAFHCQKSAAKRRGIGWELTFDQWLAWWGKDIERRGTGHDKLQMQRYGDKGPYALGNIKKGYPMQNIATWQNVARNRKADRARAEHQKFLDALISEESAEPGEDESEMLHAKYLCLPSWADHYDSKSVWDK